MNVRIWWMEATATSAPCPSKPLVGQEQPEQLTPFPITALVQSDQCISMCWPNAPDYAARVPCGTFATLPGSARNLCQLGEGLGMHCEFLSKEAAKNYIQRIASVNAFSKTYLSFSISLETYSCIPEEEVLLLSFTIPDSRISSLSCIQDQRECGFSVSQGMLQHQLYQTNSLYANTVYNI